MVAARGCVCQALSCLLLGAYRYTQLLWGKQQRGVMCFLCVCCWQCCKLYLKNLSLGVRPNKAVICPVWIHSGGRKYPVPKGATFG